MPIKTNPHSGSAASSHLVSQKDGLFRRSPGGGLTRIAAPLRVLSRAREVNGTKWSRLVELTNADDESKRHLIPDKFLSESGGQHLFSALEDVGFDLPDERADRIAIRKYIRNPAIDRRTLIVRTNGYVGVGKWAYVLGSEVIGADSRDYFLDSAIDADPDRYQVRGTLADWQRDIASFVTGNALPMVAIMASFVGPIIKPLGLEKGTGIQFYGDSSQGKSGLFACAASVIGPPSSGAMVSWATTLNGVDDLVLARSDSVLLIDETASAAGHKSSSAEVILPAIYRISEGSEKTRKHMGIGPRPVKARWRIFAISSSEKSLPELAKAAGMELLAGSSVRFIDIDAYAGQGLGVYDQLPKGIGSSRDLTDELKRRSEQFCGTAQREFLERLLKDLNHSEADLIKFLRDRIEVFRKHAGVQGFDGVESRIADHFAAIYAAGRLGASYAVLPWTQDEMLRVCLRCYRGVIKQHASARMAEEGEFKERLRNSTIRKQLGHLDKGSGQAINPNAPGWLKTSPSGVKEIILKSATFRELCGDLEQPAAVRMLTNKRILVRNKDGKSTVQRAIPGIEAARGQRYYVFDQKALHAWLDAAR
jgi:putative DNA primase/helicase